MSSNDQHQFKDRYMLRLPDGMRDRIKAAAEANNRSMNAEIVARLESSFTTNEREAGRIASAIESAFGKLKLEAPETIDRPDSVVVQIIMKKPG